MTPANNRHLGRSRDKQAEQAIGLKGMAPSPAFCDRQWRELLDALPAAIYTTDASGRITFFNRAAVEFSGRTPELGSDQWWPSAMCSRISSRSTSTSGFAMYRPLALASCTRRGKAITRRIHQKRR
jgi:PAS domain-containing protein